MSDELNLDNEIERKITEVQFAISGLEKKVAFSKKFKNLYDNEDFQEVIMKTLLGTEMKLKAESLVNPLMDEEQEQDTLVVLRSLRYLNKFISDRLYDVDNAELALKDNQNYLQELIAER